MAIATLLNKMINVPLLKRKTARFFINILWLKSKSSGCKFLANVL